MKEYLIIKGMDFIGNKLIKVSLIPDPENNCKVQPKQIDFGDVVGVYKQVNDILQQEVPKERIVFMGVDEWKKNNYGFASKIVLDVSPGGK